MAPKIGYLLPTREQIMEGKPEAAPLLELATRAEAQGFDSVWVGDSVTARPRHDALGLLAGVAGRVPRVQLGTAVLLPALRNPVLLAHQVATLDQISEGRVILGVGFAADVPNIRAEFEACGVPFDKRIGRMMEGLRLMKALWSGEPVDWDGRWKLSEATVGPTPHRAGGPPLWIGGNLPSGLERTGKFFDGWFPSAPAPDEFAANLAQVKQIAKAAGRDAAAVEGAIYLTLALDDDAAKADARLNSFLERYYKTPAAQMRSRQACYAGPVAGVAALLEAYAKAGVDHFCVRFAGEHETHMTALGKAKVELGW
jgi:alkanesulfonate monooxygenase SsuD/methylene tetrahydromethanopterin reductase-like flavin-dependent oxidoreductase (luciferase family)